MIFSKLDVVLPAFIHVLDILYAGFLQVFAIIVHELSRLFLRLKYVSAQEDMPHLFTIDEEEYLTTIRQIFPARMRPC